jgi:hypothetical protein
MQPLVAIEFGWLEVGLLASIGAGIRERHATSVRG